MKHPLSKYEILKRLANVGSSTIDSGKLIGLALLASLLFRLRPLTDLWIGSQRITTVRISFQGRPLLLHLRLQDINMFKEVFVQEEYRLPVFDATDGYVVDLGGNIGLSSLYFDTLLRGRLPIVTLEPSPPNYLLLKQNTTLHPTISAESVAISSTSGSQAWVEDTLGYNSRLAQSPDESSDTVSTISMPDLIRAHDIARISVLKIDIEGYEEELFSGAHGWLAIVDFILIEVHDTAFVEELTSLLASYDLLPVPSASSIYLFERRS